MTEIHTQKIMDFKLGCGGRDTDYDFIECDKCLCNGSIGECEEVRKEYELMK